MSTRSISSLLGGVLAAALPLAGCTADTRPRPDGPAASAPADAPAAIRLVSFDSCDQLLTDLRRAARDSVGPLGFPGVDDMVGLGAARTALPGAAGASAGASAGGGFSATNVHEAGADEPDIVKTDGRRIVSISDGVLRVVDVAGRRQTGRLDLDARGDANLLLAGDSALVLMPGREYGHHGGRTRRPADRSSELLLVNLAGTPTVVSRYRTRGTILDARQTGTTARVVLRTSPQIRFPELPNGTGMQEQARVNRAAVDAAPIDTWLPTYEVTTGARTETGRVGCDRVSRPAEYSGASLVTVLSFDLAAPALGGGDPVSVVADGDTVYATGTALYVANDQRWRTRLWRNAADSTAEPRTEIYRFDTAGTAPPRYAAGGSVPGWLLNQYALSEWDSHLRVATTDGAGGEGASAVRVLRRQGESLVQAGVVDGLGKGERIYSVRFLGPRGYVVTFRQTDPLYSLDLSDPAKPTVTGELKITGYSSHLQPAGDGRLLGIGQEATAQGRIRGTQISLFDVTGPQPRRIAQHHVAMGHSEAEHDPHALLWWPATNLLVAPMTTDGRNAKPAATALALRVGDAGLTVVGSVGHPPQRHGYTPPVRRSLVVGDVLWTLSDAGLMAGELSTLKRLAWLPMT